MQVNDRVKCRYYDIQIGVDTLANAVHYEMMRKIIALGGCNIRFSSSGMGRVRFFLEEEFCEAYEAAMGIVE